MSEILKRKLTVALVQMQSQDNVKSNFEQAVSFLSEAIEVHQAKLIVYPENFLCLCSGNYSLFVDEFQSCIQEFKVLAEYHGVSLLLGSIPFPKDDSSKKCFSRSILINDHGEIVCRYDKIHLFDALVADTQGQYQESKSFEAGDQVQTVPVADHMLGLSICYDLRFPELYQYLRLHGAEMISVPSAFTYSTGEAHWEILLRARAIETQCFVLAANQCGSHPAGDAKAKRETWGHSMIIDPWGRVLTSLSHTPGVCSAELDFQDLDRIRQSMDLVGHKKL